MSPEDAAARSAVAPDEPPATPDFDVYPVPAAITAVEPLDEDDGRIVRLRWSDGLTSRYYAIWLRDNATDPEILNPETREPWSDITAIPPDIRVQAARVDEAGYLELRWQPGGATSRFHPGWLYAHDYDNPRSGEGVAAAPDSWSGKTLAEPPTFDGTHILDDDGILDAWLGAIRVYGIARLTGVAAVDGMVARVAERIGPVRDTNFGRIFDVRVQTGPGSNAYSDVALTPHTDLPTREYQPGLQLLHCLQSTSSGGRAIMVDGFHLAAVIRESDPAAYGALTRIAWPSSNRAIDTDYRWQSPVIRLDGAGRVEELRVVPFLRAPLDAPFDEVEEAYRSLRVFFALANDPEHQMRFAYAEGDLVAMDNRRILHGREAYERATSRRWLQGCYCEREELDSRLRILARNSRAAAGER